MFEMCSRDEEYQNSLYRKFDEERMRDELEKYEARLHIQAIMEELMKTKW